MIHITQKMIEAALAAIPTAPIDGMPREHAMIVIVRHALEAALTAHDEDRPRPTRREADLLVWLRQTLPGSLCPPTLREMGDALGVTAQRALGLRDGLVKKGYLRIPGDGYRRVEIVQ
jgi:hypothetical protein